MPKTLRTRILATGQMAPTMGALHARGIVDDEDFKLYCKLLLNLEALDKTLQELELRYEVERASKGNIVSLRA